MVRVRSALDRRLFKGRASPDLFNAMSRGLIHSNGSRHINSLKGISSCFVKISNLLFHLHACERFTVLLQQPWKSPVHHISGETSSIRRRENYLAPLSIFCRIQLIKGSWCHSLRSWGSIHGGGTSWDTYLSTCLSRTTETTPNTVFGGPESENEFSCKHSHISHQR